VIDVSAPAFIEPEIGGIARRRPVVKSVIVGPGGEVEKSGTVLEPRQQIEAFYSQSFALVPDWEPNELARHWENSSTLRPNIDAFVTNVYGFGWTFKPVLDPDAPDAPDRMADALYAELIARQQDPVLALNPTIRNANPDEIDPRGPIVEQALMRLRREMRRQKMVAEAFFASCHMGEGVHSLGQLFARTGEEKEILGNAYLEGIPNGAGQLAKLGYVPSYTIRLMPLVPDDEFPVPTRRAVSPMTDAFDMVPQRFRRYVQVVFGFQALRWIHFKSWGDPRVMSRTTGRYYESVEALKADDKHDDPATELLHFAIPNPRSPYGLPRWHGAALAVLGDYEADKLTYFYLRNDAIPDFVVAVSGGDVNEGMEEKLNAFLSAKFRGTENSGRAIILAADSLGPQALQAAGVTDSRVRIDIKPLNAAHWQDAHFLKYREMNADVVGQQWRMSRLARGDIRDFNRATAERAIAYVNQQVFQPERDQADSIVNGAILPRIGVNLWKFHFNAPVLRDPKEVAEILKTLGDAGFITPEDGAESLNDALGREVPRRDEHWMRQPFPLSVRATAPTTDLTSLSSEVEPPVALADPTQVPGGVAGGDPAAAALANLRAPGKPGVVNGKPKPPHQAAIDALRAPGAKAPAADPAKAALAGLKKPGAKKPPAQATLPLKEPA